MPDLHDIVRLIAESAREGEQIEAYAGRSLDTHVRAYDSSIESLSSAESAGIGVRVICENRQGFAYVGRLDEQGAREALEEARDNATFATPEEHAGLAVPDDVTVKRLEIWHDGLPATSPERKTELALELDRRLQGADPRITKVVMSDYYDGASEFAVHTSTGIASSARRTRCSLWAEVIADDGSGPQTGWSHSVGRSPDELDGEAVARDCVERATRLLGARKPDSETLTAVFDPRVSASFLSVVARAMSGSEVVKGRSMFAGRIGEDVAVGHFTLVEDPTDDNAYGAAEIDSEGLACRRVALVESGKLQGFLYDTLAARQAGQSSTASAVRGGFKGTPGVGARALALQPGTEDQNAILASIGNGVYIQAVSGIHSGVNHVSGDFSVGARGLMIRDGALAEPVREMTIASTIQKMLQHVIAIGSDVEQLPQNATGVTLAIGEMAMSGA
jgi:PmbA protein